MKRARAPNFTSAEIMHLLQLVEKYPIIENKRTDGATTKEKQAAWHNLCIEYNAQTNFCPRTVDNLMCCYKNQKIKVKKMHSNDKMTIIAPLLLDAVEQHGQDWDRVALATETTTSVCKQAFNKLVKDAKREDAFHKKEINRTGGGPPIVIPEDPIVEKVKNLIGPSLEGLYTIYDGDADYMKEQQARLPDDMQAQPLELESSNSPQPEQESYKSSENKRLNIIKKKVDPSLEPSKKGKKKMNVSHSFQELAQDKQDLVKVQKILTDYQIHHQQLLIELAKEKLEFEKEKSKVEKEKNEMELQFLKKKYELELHLLQNNSKENI